MGIHSREGLFHFFIFCLYLNWDQLFKAKHTIRSLIPILEGHRGKLTGRHKIVLKIDRKIGGSPMYFEAWLLYMCKEYNRLEK